MNAEQLRLLIITSLADYDSVVEVRPTSTFFSDRLALAVEDRAGLLWRVWVAKDPVGGER